MDHSRQVVITGVGVVSPIGVGRDEYWAALQAGTSGVANLTAYDCSNLPVKFGAELRDFNPKLYVKPRKSLKVMGREIQTAFSAAALAKEDAGLAESTIDPDRFGTVFASEVFFGDIMEYADVYRRCIVDGEFSFERYSESFATEMYPLWMLKYLPNMAASHIAIANDARGPNNTVVLGDVSSLLALSEAVSVIERGAADVMLTGGTGSRLSITGIMYRGTDDLSHFHENPEEACRPFDARRDGMVNGEGAGAFVLESRAHAEARQAKILASVVGCGNSYDVTRDNLGDGRSDAVRRSIEMALAAANIGVEEVDHVNAHGLGMVDEDSAEAMGIHDVLSDVPVTALKSFFGHLGSGSGAVEMAGSVLGMQAGLIPHTRNYSQPDERCPVNVVAGEMQPCKKRTVVTLNQSDTCQAVAVAFTAE